MKIQFIAIFPLFLTILAQEALAQVKVDDELLERIQKTLNTSMVKNPNPKDRAEEIDAWEVPERLLKEYPYYLTGFDFEQRPIWIAHWGKFNLRKIVHEGQASQDEFMKYAEKTVRVLYKSSSIIPLPDNERLLGVFIIDFEGLSIDQVGDFRTVQFALKLAQLYVDDVVGGVKKVVLVNVNNMAQIAIRLAKPILGNVYDRLEVFGTNKASWIPKLRRLFPQESLPEMYGGTKDHKPLFIYG